MISTIILRELRAEARRPWNFYLRMLAGLVVLVPSGAMAFFQSAAGGGSGKRVFDVVNGILYFLIWVLAPTLTADCLSGEKREGTLGLLFLTALKPKEVVLGKSLVHAVRAFSFVGAALPVLAISILLGGVTGPDLLEACAKQLGALALALGAGLLASSLTKSWIAAIGFSAAFAALGAALHSSALRSPIGGLGLVLLAGFLVFALQRPWVAVAGVFATVALTTASFTAGVFRFRRGWNPLWDTTQVLALCFLLWVSVHLFVVRRVRANWQDKPLTLRQLWWIKIFWSPMFWRQLLRQSLGRTLTQSPIAWLQRYSTGARVSKWIWCGLALWADCRLLAMSGFEEFVRAQIIIALAIAFNAAASFRKERQNGAIELILVTPLTQIEIISGRLRAIWSQFGWALAIILLPGFWLAASGVFGPTDVALLYCFAHTALVLGTFVSLPVIGLYYSCRVGNLISAWVCTCVVGLVMPVTALWAIRFFMLGSLFPSGNGSEIAGVLLLSGFAQLGIAAVVAYRLFPALPRSAFALGFERKSFPAERQAAKPGVVPEPMRPELA